MASFNAGTTFTDGVANDVTAAKLGTLITAATPTSGFIQDRTAETVIASNDTVLIGDASDSNALKRITVANFAQTLPTAKITTGTIETGTFGTTTSTAATITTLTAGTTTSTAATITTGTIPTLVATTLITSGTGTATSPAISPTGDSNTGVFFPAADTIAFSEGGTESMRIDSSGRVGIGTTSPNAKTDIIGSLKVGAGTYAVPNNHLHVQGGNYGDSTSEGVINIVGGVGDNNYPCGFTLRSQKTGAGGFGDPIFTISETVWSTTNFTKGTERLRIDSSGNVGIGNTSPTSYNASGDNLVVGNTGDNGITIVSGTDGKGYLFFADGTSGANAYAGQVDFDHSVNALRIGVGGTERLRIDSSGNVGIGTTNPLNKLHVKHSSAGVMALESSGSDQVQITFRGTTGDRWAVGNNAATGGTGLNFDIYDLASSVNRLRIDSSGNCSIGTSTALSRLHVHGDITLSNTTTATTAATGTVSKPATYAGFLTVSINGTSRKIPYYA